MNPGTARRLTELNRVFYDRFGESFAATRRRIQPGVRRVLSTIGSSEAVLDVGCGTGGVARALAEGGHAGRYVGIDYSGTMLHQAEQLALPFTARFLLADIQNLQELLRPDAPLGSRFEGASFDCALAFAVLHHVPDEAVRMRLLEAMHRLLRPGGRFVHSNWQFLNSRKLAARIQPWQAAGVNPEDVDPNDYLLDWRGGGRGLRYVHHFTLAELSLLALKAGFRVADSFQSDGKGGQLSLYQVWKKTNDHSSPV